ncbi:MAG: hypothetical protein PHT69_09430 [Bacteroidales bacterium]|nr:hypothetical protein [Bacteroidales bacterium]
MKRQIILIFLFILALQCRSQYFNFGQSPSGLKWEQIKTDRFRLIFPQDYSGNAQKMAHYLETSYPKVTYGPSLTDRTPVIIHNQGLMSNGFVAWAPQRIELFPAPAQRSLALDYSQHLAVHELRHVVQLNTLKQSTTKFLSYLFGEQAIGAITGLYLPLWFLEGDAVLAETALTLSGRGRYSEFTNKLRAQLCTIGKYPYDKAVFGSYRDFTPNHYELGYFMTGHARHLAGKNIWPDVITHVARNPFGITSFSKGIKKTTGFRKIQLYNSCMDSIRENWEEHLRTITLTDFIVLTPQKKTYTNYDIPVLLNDSNFISVKKSYDDIDKMVHIDADGHEELIMPMGFGESSTISAHGNKLYFVVNKPDSRWQNRNYSNIISFDMANKRQKQLTRKGRYQTAEVSPNGNILACVHTQTDGTNSLHIINASTAEVTKIINTPENHYIINPNWIDDNYLVCVLNSTSGMGNAISILDTRSGEFKTIKNFEYEELNSPVVYKSFILFASSYTGIENIFAIDINTKKIFQLTSAAFGMTKPVINNNSNILYTLNYTENGYEIVYTPIDSLLWIPINESKTYRDVMLETILTQDSSIIDFSSNQPTAYKIKKYNKFLNIFNFHSWGPLNVNTDNNTINPGFVFYNQNLLSTLTGSLGYKYSTAENTGAHFISLKYDGLYPLFDFSFERGYKNFNINDTTRVPYSETKYSGSVVIPFILTGKHYVRQLQLFTFNHHYDYVPPKNNDTLETLSINAFEYGISFSNSRLKSQKDIYPKFSQRFIGRYAHSPLSPNNMGDIWAGRLQLFFPGFAKHHSFSVVAIYQKRKAEKIAFSYYYPFSRGYYDIAWKFSEAYTLQFNYTSPLFYPDWSLGPIVYIKRIRQSVFFDYSQTYNNSGFLRSFGLDLTVDSHVLRFIAPVSFGLRSIYNQNSRKFLFEPLFSINFDAL